MVGAYFRHSSDGDAFDAHQPEQLHAASSSDDRPSPSQLGEDTAREHRACAGCVSRELVRSLSCGHRGAVSMGELITMPASAELARIAVVSPHFDDAVQGTGYLLAGQPGTTVITVFGGRPPAYPEPPSEWDALGGFRSGDDVVALRREEDAAALAVLGAEHVWLDFADHQYLPPEARPSAATISTELRAALDADDPTAVFVPFGLGNPDHDATHQAARLLMDDRPGWSWFCYEDAGYCHLPGLLAWRVSSLFRAGRSPTPAIVPVELDPARKRRALECYRSQLPPLRADHRLDERLAAPAPEQYWHVAPPPDGWEALVDVPG
jgi:LmbE family N-acetylglucosaminyl deacetylase